MVSTCDRGMEEKKPGQARVLVVDDCDDTRDITGRLLDMQGFEWAGAENGKTALDLMSLKDFDLILLDLSMPVMNGFEFLKELRSSERWKDTPVIIMTGKERVESAWRLRDVEADDYLFKPFDPVIMKTKIRVNLENRRLRDLNMKYAGRIREMEDRHGRGAPAAIQPTSASWLTESFRLSLCSMLSMVRLMDSSTGSLSRERIKETAGKILGTGDSLIEMLDFLDWLSLPKITQPWPRHKLFHLASHIERVFANLSFLASGKDIGFVSHAPPDSLIHGDPEMVYRLIYNAVLGVVVHRGDGGVVTVRSLEGGLSIHGEGIGGDGFHAEKDGRWLETGAGDDDLAPECMGLRSCVCRETITLHGGMVFTAKNQKGDMMLRLNLPKARPVVMIVDDSEDDRFLTKLYLEKFGVDIMEAENGRAALDMVEKTVPHFFIVDLNMPELDGFGFIRVIRSDPKTSSLPVIMVTSDTNPDVHKTAKTLGINQLLAKPLIFEDFSAALHSLAS